MPFLSGRTPRTLSHTLPTRFSTAVLAAALVMLLSASASAQIKEPGNHPDYSVELEPHALFEWVYGPAWGGEGFGLGARATIPIIQDGPIKTINNSMGIGFGLDWVHYSSACWNYYGWGRYWGPRGYPGGYDCSANSLLFPVVMQWNFWLTKVISVFGEPGFGIEHYWASAYAPGACGPYGLCPYTYSDTYFRFIFQGGARFMFGDVVGLTVRVGVPYLSVGASFLL